MRLRDFRMQAIAPYRGVMSISMDDEEFQSFIDSSYDDLEKKQSYLENQFGLGHFERYDLEPKNERIIFRSSDGKKVQANFIPIGTFSPGSGSWMWGWNNSAFTDSLRVKAESLKLLSEITGFEMFSNPTSEVDEDMAWEMVAMAVHTLKSEGVYRAPANN
ncbi:hypothetical protein OAP14_01220, partial [Aliiglaciecola sp.]|nr:hypothetical protein [Aliiglaciecola sp.]